MPEAALATPTRQPILARLEELREFAKTDEHRKASIEDQAKIEEQIEALIDRARKEYAASEDLYHAHTADRVYRGPIIAADEKTTTQQDGWMSVVHQNENLATLPEVGSHTAAVYTELGQKAAVISEPTGPQLVDRLKAEGFEEEADDYGERLKHQALAEYEKEAGEEHRLGMAAAMPEDRMERQREEEAQDYGIQLAEDEGIAKATARLNSGDQDREPIAIKLTDEQGRLLVSAEYPNDLKAQTHALYDLFENGKPIDLMHESVQLDYSSDIKGFFASLDRDEKPALDAKLVQLRSEEERSKLPPSKEKEKEYVRERSRDRERG
jgi:hypothetical protein